MTKISVIIRTHNSEDFVSNAINSVLNQTIPRESFEIMVVDDGSTDGTMKVLKSFGNIIKIIENQGKGAISASNLGINNTKSEYMILLDSDDTFEPTTLEEMLKAANDSSADFVYADYYENDTIKETRKTINTVSIFQTIAAGVLIRTSLVKKSGGYDESLIFPEYDLLIKMIGGGAKGVHIPKPLYNYNRREGSITSNKETVDKGRKQLAERHGEIKGLRDY